MHYYKLQAIPHFIVKSPAALEDAKRELLQEYGGFLRFLLASQRQLSMHLRSMPNKDGSAVDSVEVGYELPHSNEDLDVYLKTLARYIRVAKEEPKFADLPLIGKLRRRVQLVAVGDIDKVPNSELSLIPE